MRVMLDSCDQMIDMVDTLLEVSRIEQGETGRRLDTRTVALGEILDTALASVRGLADKKDATIDVSLPAEPLEVVGDPSLAGPCPAASLEQRAQVRAGPRNRFRPRAGRETRPRRSEVEDQGIGISPEHLPHIFEKFYVADGGLDRRRGGAGVGLYLAREIVRLHHGTIEVLSQPGRGSVFSVTLPGPSLARAPRPALEGAPWLFAVSALAIATPARRRERPPHGGGAPRAARAGLDEPRPGGLPRPLELPRRGDTGRRRSTSRATVSRPKSCA